MDQKIRSIIQYDDKKRSFILREKTKPVKSIDNELKNLFKDLKRLAKENSKEGIILVGLSAPQIGENLSAFIFFDLKEGKYKEVINPRIIYESKESTKEWEGCASIGTGATSLFGHVERKRFVQIQYLDLNSKEKILSSGNFQSHIILHEIDHLNGILFLDRVPDKTKIFTAKELDEYSKKHNGNYPS